MAFTGPTASSPSTPRGGVLACNVDRKGRLLRASWGVMSLALGLLTLSKTPQSPVWLVVSVLFFGGAVWGIVLGGAKGWCAARALGIKTPI